MAKVPWSSSNNPYESGDSERNRFGYCAGDRITIAGNAITTSEGRIGSMVANQLSKAISMISPVKGIWIGLSR